MNLCALPLKRLPLNMDGLLMRSSATITMTHATAHALVAALASMTGTDLNGYLMMDAQQALLAQDAAVLPCLTT